MAITIAGIQVGKIRSEGDSQTSDSMNRHWTTAFYKFPAAGLRTIHPLGVEGDEIADTKNHGGVDKAVLGYSANHYAAWRTELESFDFGGLQTDEHGPDAFGFGAFAENLTISGQDETQVCIGDRYRIGTDETNSVILEVSQPRQPCWKISRRWKHKTLTKRVAETGRTGWYFRVLREGTVDVGDEVKLLARRHPLWTVARANDVLLGRESDRYAVAELMAMEELAPAWKLSLN